MVYVRVLGCKLAAGGCERVCMCMCVVVMLECMCVVVVVSPGQGWRRGCW